MSLINVPYNPKYIKTDKEGQKIVVGKSTRMIYLSFYDFHGHRSDNPVELNILTDKDWIVVFCSASSATYLALAMLWLHVVPHILYIRPLRFYPINLTNNLINKI